MKSATVITWLPTLAEDPADARDFAPGTHFGGDELRYMLRDGVLPVNLVLDQGGQVVIVVGKGDNQRLVPYFAEVRV